MSLYGSSLYGMSYYGDGDYDLQLWKFHVVWASDEPAGTNEAENLIDLQIMKGRKMMLKSDGSGFQPVDVAEGYAILTNYDRKYDARNVHSPLYPNVKPGKAVVISTMNGTEGDEYVQITGRITTIEPVSGDVNTIRIDFEGIVKKLDDKMNISFYINQQVDDLFSVCLLAAGWDADKIAIDSSLDAQPFFFAYDQSYMERLSELADAQFGTFFVAGDGTAKFYNRSHSAAAAAEISEDEMEKTLRIPQPWENVKNKISIKVHRMTAVSGVTIWTLDQPILIYSKSTVEIWVDYSYGGDECPASGVAASGFTGNTAEDGSGTNITYELAVTVTDFGTRAKLSIYNDSVLPSGYIRTGNLTGTAYTTKTIQVEESDAASIVEYGEKPLNMTNNLVQEYQWAKSYAEYLKTVGPTGLDPIYADIIGRPDLQFGLDLFDRVTLDLPSLGISGDYAVGYMEHKWQADSGQLTRTSYIFEPIPFSQEGVWKFPVQIGVNAIFGF